MRGFALILVVFACAARAQSVCPERAVWPSPDWEEARATKNVEALETYAFSETLRTDSVLIIRSGRIIYERYGRGFTRENRHPGRSVSKNFSSALIGIAVRDGLVELDESICTYLTEFKGREQCAIRVIDTITHGSGLAWQELGEDGVQSSLWAMLQGEGHRDQISFVLGHALETEPGTRFVYNTGTASVASAIAQRVLGPKYGRDAFWRVLFEPIGAPGIVLEYDANGAPIGGSALYATPRDFARLGYLFLNDGCWRGSRVLPQGWVPNSIEPSQVFMHSDELPDAHSEANGYMWWVNKPLPPPFASGLPLADVPEGSFGATGRWNQLVYVIPKMDLVVVRTADDRGGGFDLNQFLKLAMDVAR